MHIYFSGIGGTAIGPLALIARQAGYTVSGSDKQDSAYIQYLRSHGVEDIYIGSDASHLTKVHQEKPIEWLVYSSAVAIEDPNSEQLIFCKNNGIKTSKRDELLNKIIQEKNLKLLAIAGTHGKTTTTAMLVWLLKRLNLPVSYSVGAKISFGEMGEYDPRSEYFVYEADEFDNNFLAFKPFISIITGVAWDHPDIFPTKQIYDESFRQFIGQCKQSILWQQDADQLGLANSQSISVIGKTDELLQQSKLVGDVNRQNAYEVAVLASKITDIDTAELLTILNDFPGLSRRFEQLVAGLYTDYAHTPEKIRGALQIAQETAGGNVVVIYEGLHNTRQHFIKDELPSLFEGAKKVYVVPSYLAREDPNLPLLSPGDLVSQLNNKDQAEASQLNSHLKQSIQQHLANGDLVLCLSAGGGNSLDEWLRKEFQTASE